MSEELPQSIGSGTVNIMGVDLTFHMLDNGERVIEADSMERFFEALAGGAEITPDDAMKLANAIRTR